MPDDVDYRAALLEVLTSGEAWLSVLADPIEVGIDGSFNGPALTAAVVQLRREGLLKTDGELEREQLHRSDSVAPLARFFEERMLQNFRAAADYEDGAFGPGH